jgi:hypothetical protein
MPLKSSRLVARMQAPVVIHRLPINPLKTEQSSNIWELCKKSNCFQEEIKGILNAGNAC